MKKILIRIPLFKFYYLGKEYIKNPPYIEGRIEGVNIENLYVRNASVKLNVNDKLSNCIIENTIPFYLTK